MARQTTTAAAPAALFAGMVAEGFTTETDTKVNRDANMPFGIAVVDASQDGGGKDKDDVKLPSTTGQRFMGVTQHSHAIEAAGASLTGTEGIPATHPCNVLRRGRIAVVVEEAISLGDAVFFRHTAGVGEQVGAFRTDADTADADEITEGAEWVSETTGAGIAILELNLPV